MREDSSSTRWRSSGSTDLRDEAHGLSFFCSSMPAWWHQAAAISTVSPRKCSLHIAVDVTAAFAPQWISRKYHKQTALQEESWAGGCDTDLNASCTHRHSRTNERLVGCVLRRLGWLRGSRVSFTWDLMKVNSGGLCVEVLLSEAADLWIYSICPAASHGVQGFNSTVNTIKWWYVKFEHCPHLFQGWVGI